MRQDSGVLACGIGAGFATLVDSAVVTFAVPPLGHDLHAPTSGVQWFLSVYSLTFGLGLVPGGRLGDVFGRRTLFVVGLVAFAVGALSAAAAPGIWWAVSARAGQGLGAGLISAQVLGIIQDHFQGRNRVRALAAYGAAGASAAAVGPLGAGLLLAVLPAEIAWRAVLALNIPFILVTLVLTLRFVPREPVRPKRIDLDLPAIALVGAFVFLVTVPVIHPGIGGGRLWTIVGTCGALALATIGWERRYAGRGRMPLFVPALMTSRGFVTGNLVALLWFGGLLGLTTVLTIYLLLGFGWSPLLVAAVLVPGAIGRIVASSLSSRVYERFGALTLPGCLGIQLVGTVALVAATGTLTKATLIVAVIVLEVVIGVASGLFEPPLRTVTLSFAPPGHHGVAASFLQLAQRLSSTFCVALVTGVMLAADMATAGTSGLQHGLLICSGLVAAALLVSLSPALRIPAPAPEPLVPAQ